MEPNPFIIDVMTQLKKLVETGALTGWSLQVKASRSHQRLYAAPDGATLACHQSRRVNGDAYALTVYCPGATDAQVGTAQLDLVSFRPIDEQLTEALELARDSQNQKWVLAGPPSEPPQSVETCDPALRDRPEQVLESIEGQFAESFAATNGCRLNSAELFLNYSLSTISNSEGLSYSMEQSDLYLEAAMEKAGQENDKEVHEYTTSVTLDDLNVRAFVEECALQVSVLGESEEPQTTDRATLLIGKAALSQMLEAVLQQLDRANEYLKRPFMKPGDSFGGGAGDALELRLDPTIPCMVLSSAYTVEGLPAKSGLLIKENTVTDGLIGNRFGQYLGLTPNGISGNLVVAPGSLTPEKLQGLEYIEVIKFSSLLIDAQKMTWSSEIKLGREIAADGTITLVKGGVISGNLRDNFTDCRFSSTLGTVNLPKSSYAPPLGYRGPDAMLITRGVSVAGKTLEKK